jgi:hypothetical protein
LGREESVRKLEILRYLWYSADKKDSSGRPEDNVKNCNFQSHEENSTMDVIAKRVEVWAASIKDKPGRLARVLMGLKEAGADLNFIVARRAPEKPGTGVVFLTPLRGDREVEAASHLGFNVSRSIHSVRIDGENRPGIVADLTEKVGAAGINLRGLSAAVLGARFILYVGLDGKEDAKKTVEILQQE